MKLAISSGLDVADSVLITASSLVSVRAVAVLLYWLMMFWMADRSAV